MGDRALTSHIHQNPQCLLLYSTIKPPAQGNTRRRSSRALSSSIKEDSSKKDLSSLNHTSNDSSNYDHGEEGHDNVFDNAVEDVDDDVSEYSPRNNGDTYSSQICDHVHSDDSTSTNTSVVSLPIKSFDCSDGSSENNSDNSSNNSSDDSSIEDPNDIDNLSIHSSRVTSPIVINNALSNNGIFDNPSKSEMASMKLLKILDDLQAPLYGYDVIMKWAAESFLDGYQFQCNFPKRQAVLGHLRKRFYPNQPQPFISNIHPTPNKKIQIVRFPFVSALLDLITNEDLMNPHNLLLNPTDPFAKYVPDHLDDVLSARWYAKTYENIISDPENEFLLPLIFYIDKTHIDVFGRLTLEPLQFTLGIFKRKLRNLPKAWRVLGYITDSSKSSSQKARDRLNKKTAAVDVYHQQLSKILTQLKMIQHRGLKTQLKLGDTTKEVILRIPIAFIICDCLGAENLCCKYTNRNEGVMNLSRYCIVNPDDASDPHHVCKPITAQMVQDLVNAKDIGQLDSMSHHCVPNAFHSVSFGGNPGGIHSSTPWDSLHGLLNGLMPYCQKIILDMVPGSTKALFDDIAIAISRDCRQLGKRQLPRMSFPKGFTNLSLLTANERSGICIQMVLTMSTSVGETILGKECGFEKIQNACFVLQGLLCFEAWIKREAYWRVNKYGRNPYEEEEARKSIREFLDLVLKYCPRDKGMGWRITKFHECLHIVDYMVLFGSPQNYQSGPNESHHISLHKRPSRTAQKRPSVFCAQAAERLRDATTIRHCFNRYCSNKTINDSITKDGTLIFFGSSHFRFIPDPGASLGWKVTWNTIANTRNLKLLDGLKKFLLKNVILGLPSEKQTSLSFYSQFQWKPGMVVRSHPGYYQGNPWYDWIMVQYEKQKRNKGKSNKRSQDETYNIPAMICCAFTTHDIKNMSTMSIGSPDLLSKINIVVWTCKNYKPISLESGIMYSKWEMETDTKGAPHFRILTADSLVEPVFAIRDYVPSSTLKRNTDKKRYPLDKETIYWFWILILIGMVNSPKYRNIMLLRGHKTGTIFLEQTMNNVFSDSYIVFLSIAIYILIHILIHILFHTFSTILFVPSFCGSLRMEYYLLISILRPDSSS